MIIRGPNVGQAKTCIAATVCNLAAYAGHDLQEDGIVLIAPSSPPATADMAEFALRRMPSDGYSESITADGLGTYLVSWGVDPAPIDGGACRLYHRGLGYGSDETCSVANPSTFIVGSRELQVDGPLVLENRFWSTPGRHCFTDEFAWETVVATDEDLLFVPMVTCGASNDAFPSFPNNSISEPATNDGRFLARAEDASSVILATTQGGIYSLCWSSSIALCVDSLDCITPVGQMEILGPDAQRDAACVTGQSRTIGTWSGRGISNTDKVLLAPGRASLTPRRKKATF